MTNDKPRGDDMSSPQSIPIRSSPVPRATAGRIIGSHRVASLATGALRWLRRRHTRQVLAALDDHQLRDIGLTRNELSKL
jgi:uncharacterized protein YjiS (DUF1127 family)